ncbi:MAG: exo-beta-N-acetylmuramidase NamZ domain-containing protein [Planctomycetota bacterium]
MSVTFGLEACLESPPELLRHSRGFGLLSNQASVDRNFRHAAERMHKLFPRRLKKLFGPQHGLWSAQQDNMIETGHGVHPRLGLPVYSLYSDTRRPTQQMLDELDLLVVDLQDVGTRVYTWIWTVMHCLEACAQKGIPLLVLDRPNPLGGEVAEGPRLDPAFRSFVGGAAIPMRHGLSFAELTRCINDQNGIGADLHVVPMRGWTRSMLWPDTGRAWVPPSPNLPRWEGVFVYPGQVLLEGTNLSEGRGTTAPFEQWGAPFVDPYQIPSVLAPRELQGLAMRPVEFEPTFQKWQGQPCRGQWLHVTDLRAFRPYRTTLALLRAVQELWPKDSAWLQPPYEYERDKMPIDILTGGPAVREWVGDWGSWAKLDLLAAPPDDWWSSVRRWLLY